MVYSYRKNPLKQYDGPDDGAFYFEEEEEALENFAAGGDNSLDNYREHERTVRQRQLPNQPEQQHEPSTKAAGAGGQAFAAVKS